MVAGPAPLGAAALGERWVVRHRLADGSATDAVGWIDELGPERIELSGVDGATQQVSPAAVILARRAPAALGGPDPRRVPAEELQQRSLPGWLARHEPLGEWTLRAGDGFTGRANSCLAVGDPGVGVDEATRRIIAHAGTHGIAPMAQVITGSGPELALRARGWTTTYEATDVLVVRLTELLEDRPQSATIEVSETLHDSWRTAYQLSRPNQADPAVLELILDGHPPRAFASRTGSTQPSSTQPGSTQPSSTPPSSGQPPDGAPAVSIGRGHLSRDWLGLAAIWTDPEHRRTGLATAVLAALGHWGARRGARYAYLQVAVANRPAHRAYERLGFVRHHAYGYLRPPD